MKKKVTPDNEAPSNVTDHPFTPPEGQSFGRCTVEGCGLGEAVHSTATKHYEPTATTYRCPNCVTLDKEVCEHQTEDMRSIS
jgi:hypothetical protein